jgi:8-oxo-dGTP pyrophosphatase MutT (NUDIX family)
MTSLEVEVTVHLLVQQDGKFLLVLNKPEPHGKPAGWGLPGGSILVENQNMKDLSFKTLADFAIEHIRTFMRYANIPQEKLDWILSQSTQIATDEIGLLIALTAIREGIEETGFLFMPKKVMFDSMTSITHRVVIVAADIVAGTMQKDTVETDDCDWFDIEHLPEKVYWRHKQRLDMILKGEALYA